MKERENISLMFLKRKEQFTKISRKTVHKKTLHLGSTFGNTRQYNDTLNI